MRRDGAGLVAVALTIAVLLPRVAISAKIDPLPADVAARQAAEYQAQAPKTVLELQQFRRTESVAATGAGGRTGIATLVNLNPRINAWFVLTLDWGGPHGRVSYHLENPQPGTQAVELGDLNSHGISFSTAAGRTACDLWSGANTALEAAQNAELPYSPLCGGRLYLRNRVRGNQTNLERVTDFLRDHVWGGETVIRVVKQEFYSDRFLEKGVPGTAPAAGGTEAPHPDWPRAALVTLGPGERATVPQDIDIDVGQPMSSLAPGRWYPVADLAGTYLSFVAPRSLDPQILASYRTNVAPLDEVETDALVYLVAFDLGQFDLGFTLGTDHPRVGWSERALSNMRDDKLPGPDGIDTIAPLVANGMVSPALESETIATFTGGFKREHGAFHYGPFAEKNHGMHYGFIEQGSVLSKLVPGLSTLYVLDDGTVDMKTWTEGDDALLARIRHARQNGVPLIDYDSASGVSAPGALVARWGAGNWSGSADEKLRTLRAGVCLQQTDTRRFLIYGYFSAATPSAMARVFQAYQCRYAMHLDMNALEHTYLALYVHRGSEIGVQHLVEGMAQLDKTEGSAVIPRFLGYPDDRDFFYLVRKE